MTEKNPLYSLSISARATLDMHSLNNEGGEGNQIQTRMVNVVGQDGRLYNVNAISGDMFKHIQAEHLFRLASGDPGVPLCAGCRAFNANRISADTAYTDAIGDMTDADALDLLLTRCAMDDMEGNLITEGGKSLPRKSVVEFGWVVGVPEATTTDSYFHVKYANERSQAQRAEDSSEEARGANLGQAIFHRPASSGIYAVVTNLELARIGLNDITQTYVLSDEEREARHAKLLESLLYTFLEPNGAMRGTQNPHIVALEGVVTVSQGVLPAPTVSPINDNFNQELKRIKDALDKLHPDALHLYTFDSIGAYTEVMTDLIQTTKPFKMTYTGQNDAS
jgi:CRISPR-associated protein Cst2